MKKLSKLQKWLIAEGEISERSITRKRWERHERNCQIVADKLAKDIAKAWKEQNFKRFYFINTSEGCIAKNKFGYGMGAETSDIIIY